MNSSPATLVVVQARMGSTRLPGKVLAELAGRPLLAFLLARLRWLPALTPAAVTVVVATSDLDRDDPVAALAEAEGVACVHGPELDVLTRFAMALAHHPADEVVRLTADCPLTDPALVAAAIALRRSTTADYAGNTPIRTFPDGLDVEVLSAAALQAAHLEATEPLDREHVTRFVLRQPERFRIANLRSPQLLAAERWTIDTPEDLDRVRAIVADLPDPLRAGWEQVLATAGVTARPGEDAVQPHVVADHTVGSLLQEA